MAAIACANGGADTETQTMDNITTQRFPRASRDDCLRSADVLSGPYSRAPFYRLHKWITGVMLACALVGTLAILSGALR